ncbi:MAG: 2-amino-4-hydroxy-6-hydroxymethyldihydropteridine pyrophosphokinae [Polaromonas sp.]|nr:2-amino-4-hydroxy-6-hydroxymethyldihydropteridine pyrophosphokinae [Polaromonas sp.]
MLVYIALGANLGDAALALGDAEKALAGLPGTSLLDRSSVYKTAPLGIEMPASERACLPADSVAFHPDYFNAVVSLTTSLTAPELLKHLQRIETDAGRQRPFPNAPRTLDLDLLLYGSATIDSTSLTVPHPRMWQRAFVLVPLAEIAPERVSIEQLEAVAHQAIWRVGAL